MIRSLRIHAATLCTLATALLTVPLAAQEAERFSIDGTDVAVYNLAGSVRIEPGTGANVVIEVRRTGRDAERLRLERRDVDGRAALVVRYPDDDIVYRGGQWSGRTTMRVRDDGSFFGDGSRGERVTLRSSGRGLEAHADLRILVPAGRNVEVRLGVGDVSAAGVTGDLDVDVASASVQTSRTRGRLRIDTGSGRVRVADAEGDVLVDTGSGAVELTDVRGGDVRVDTGSGAVTGGSIAADRFHVDTGSGRIAMSGVAARDLEFDTGSGSVEIDLAADVEKLRIDTGSGAVRLRVPAELGASLTVDTGSGGITVDAPHTVVRQERSFLSARLGDGRGSIEIDTGSGGVRVVRR